MNRIAGRSFIVWILVFAFVAGIAFFIADYAINARKWAMYAGSQHVYNGTKLRSGVITDRNQLLILDFSDGWQYSSDRNIRSSMLHWIGDRAGNIRAPILDEYAEELVGYSGVGGLYSYGDTVGQMVLTLDAKVQKAALEALNGRSGTVSLYNYKTGELICAVTSPNFDPDEPPSIDPEDPGDYDGIYVNRFTQSANYTPGSIFKIVTLAAALESIDDIEKRSFLCEGEYLTGDGDITCEYVHGEQTLQQAFTNSCNCAFAQIAIELGAEKLQRYIEQFGVLDSVTFDGITTARGSVQLQNVTKEDLAWTAIGQHRDQINPCGFLMFLGAIAADGIAAKPYVVSEVLVGEKTTYEAKTQFSDRILSTTSAKLVQQYMNGNVELKYGKENFPGFSVCAKSGTAEVGGGKKPHAMFAGFLQDEKHPYAFLITVENGGYGASTCIPILQAVLNELE